VLGSIAILGVLVALCACVLRRNLAKQADAEAAAFAPHQPTEVESPLTGQLRMVTRDCVTDGGVLRMSDSVRVESVRSDDTAVVVDVSTGRKACVPLSLLSA